VSDSIHGSAGDSWPADVAWLQSELAHAHRTIRSMLRQLEKARAAHAEAERAHRMTVENLVRTTGECALLERERDTWKRRAEEREASTILIGNGGVQLTSAEIGAIRKAMARLHHPDLGGDPERMKLWNMLLDPLEV
jgi:hypothetical protein